MSSHPRPLIRRPERRIPVTILALVLLVLAVAAVWILGAYLATGAVPAWAAGAVSRIGSTTLDAPAAIAVASVLILAGIAMIVSAAVPGASHLVRILDEDADGSIAVPARDVARHVRQQAEAVDGVHSARVSFAAGEGADITVRCAIDDTDKVRDQVSTAAARALEDLGLDSRVRTRVRDIT